MKQKKLANDIKVIETVQIYSLSLDLWNSSNYDAVVKYTVDLTDYHMKQK